MKYFFYFTHPFDVFLVGVMKKTGLIIFCWALAAFLKGQGNYTPIVMQAESYYGQHEFLKLEALLKPLFLETDYLETSPDPSKALIYFFKSLSVRDQISETMAMTSLARKKLVGSRCPKAPLVLDFYQASASIVLQNYDEGRRLYRKIIEQRSVLSPTLDSLIVKSYANIAVSYHMEGQWQEAEDYYQATIALLEQESSGQSLQETRAMVSANYLNLLFDVLHRYSESAVFLKKVMADPFNKQINLSNHHLYMMAADYYLAIGEHQQFLETADRLALFLQQQNPVRSGDLGYLYLLKAIYYTNMGNTTRSTLLAQQSEKLLNGEEGFYNFLPDVYELLANNHARLGDDQTTIQYLNKLIAINKKEKRYAEYYPYLMAAKHYANLRLDELAISYADSGRSAYLNLSAKNEYDIETFHGEMARIHLKLKRPRKAWENLIQLKELYHSNQLFDRFKSLEVETGMAYCELINQQPRQALKWLDQTRRQLKEANQVAPVFNTASLDRNNIDRNINIFSAMAWLQVGKSQQSMSDLKTAWEFYQMAVKDLENHLSHLDFDLDRISFANIISDYLSVGYGIALARHEIQPSQKSVDELLSFSQKEKSSALQASINSRMNKKKSHIDPVLIEQEELLLKENSYLIAALKAFKPGNNDSVATILLAKQKVIINKLEALNNRIKTEYPDYKQSCLSPSTKNLAQLQQQLHKEQAVLDYYFYKEACVLTLVKPDTFVVCSSQWDADDVSQLKLLIKEVNTPFLGLAPERISQFMQSGAHCYNKLIGPVAHLIKGCHLIIIPHQELFFLPFEVLPTQQAVSASFKSIDYLIRSNPVSYCTSLTLLPDRHAEAAVVDGVAAFAPDYGLEVTPEGGEAFTQQFDPLPGALEEISRIKKHWPLKKYSGGAANKEAFAETAEEHNIVHLAMHAYSDHAAPMQSGLVFTDREGHYQCLKAFEIYNMKFATPLLVLNACNTGSGKYVQGEGVMSLARAFQYGGVKSILTTLWPVNDQAGIRIMDDFYGNLKQRQTKQKALQQSKLKYIDEADNITAHPYYWACYTIVGDTQPLHKHQWLYSYWWLGLVLGVILFFILRRLGR